jgi:hypothetical protein
VHAVPPELGFRELSLDVGKRRLPHNQQAVRVAARGRNFLLNVRHLFLAGSE